MKIQSGAHEFITDKLCKLTILDQSDEGAIYLRNLTGPLLPGQDELAEKINEFIYKRQKLWSSVMQISKTKDLSPVIQTVIGLGSLNHLLIVAKAKILLSSL